MAYTLNGEDLGDVNEENMNKWSDLDQVSYPLSDSSEASVFDYQGVKRVITITGIKYFDTAADLWNWVQTIDALQNGDQSTVIYHSDGWDKATSGSYTDGNFNVKVNRFIVRYVNNQTLSIVYTLTLYEGEEGV